MFHIYVTKIQYSIPSRIERNVPAALPIVHVRLTGCDLHRNVVPYSHLWPGVWDGRHAGLLQGRRAQVSRQGQQGRQANQPTPGIHPAIEPQLGQQCR